MSLLDQETNKNCSHFSISWMRWLLSPYRHFDWFQTTHKPTKWAGPWNFHWESSKWTTVSSYSPFMVEWVRFLRQTTLHIQGPFNWLHLKFTWYHINESSYHDIHFDFCFYRCNHSIHFITTRFFDSPSRKTITALPNCLANLRGKKPTVCQLLWNFDSISLRYKETRHSHEGKKSTHSTFFVLIIHLSQERKVTNKNFWEREKKKIGGGPRNNKETTHALTVATMKAFSSSLSLSSLLFLNMSVKRAIKESAYCLYSPSSRRQGRNTSTTTKSFL